MFQLSSVSVRQLNRMQYSSGSQTFPLSCSLSNGTISRAVMNQGTLKL